MKKILLFCTLLSVLAFVAGCEAQTGQKTVTIYQPVAGSQSSSTKSTTPASPAAIPPTITLSGAAFLGTGIFERGLHVQKPGTNYWKNPSAQNNTTGGSPADGDGTLASAAGGKLGGNCWQFTTFGFSNNAGIAFTFAANELPVADAAHNQYALSFWARVVSTAGPLNAMKISSWVQTPGFSVRQSVADLTIGYEWQRYSLLITRTVGATPDQDLMIGVYPHFGSVAATVMQIDGVTLEGERDGTAYHESYPSNISYPVPPYHGGMPGCAWTGTAHASTSIRTMGKADYPGLHLDIDFNSSFWFGLDMTAGFSQTDDFETICNDILTIGVTGGTMGFASNIGLDFAVETAGEPLSHRLQLVYFPNEPATYAATIDLPVGHAIGDNIRVVGVYDADAATITLYAVFAGGAVLSDTADCPAPPTLPTGYTVGIGYLDFGGPWQDNSSHRYLVLEQGVPTANQIESYLLDPSVPVRNGGYFFPLIEDTNPVE